MYNIEKLTEKFLASPLYLEKGAGYLASKFRCTKEEVYKAKEEARRIKKMGSETNKLEKNDEATTRYVGSESSADGVVKKFESSEPLSPEEIERLVGVDNINTYVARVWDKLLPNGKWTYSVDIRYRVKDFYSAKQMAEKLAELMPKITPRPIPLSRRNVSQKALIICLADDHVGAVNVTNLFDNKQLSYEERLELILGEIADLGEEYEEVHIISLGDQLNGWNSQTTRGGHEVKSKSNTEQFDEYVAARMKFYDNLFESGISENYFVHDIENSNHSGLGMSYMANKALGIYLDAKYPWVFRESVTDMIGGFQYGKHVVIFGHGKDEKFQIRPMPANLNDKTDLYLYDYLQNKGYSPYKDSVTFYKGDLHQHGIQNGKFGRYVNVQSIAGNSDYGDANFGNTKGGALLEILQKESYRISSQPIWF